MRFRLSHLLLAVGWLALNLAIVRIPLTPRAVGFSHFDRLGMFAALVAANLIFFAAVDLVRAWPRR
jgi:hypothetical protein